MIKKTKKQSHKLIKIVFQLKKQYNLYISFSHSNNWNMTSGL